MSVAMFVDVCVSVSEAISENESNFSVIMSFNIFECANVLGFCTSVLMRLRRV